MNMREICEMCDNYSKYIPCDIADICKLRNIVKENRELKAKLKATTKELEELKRIRSWEINPERMGR
jgi:hypothetical protein